MKIIIKCFIISIFFFGISSAMGSSTAGKDNENKCHHKGNNKEIAINVYAKNANNSEVLSKIKPNGDESYTIFFCEADSKWCEVVNQKDGATGWINLDESKKAEEDYAKYHHKKMMFENMLKQNEEQNKKIIMLERDFVSLKKELSHILTSQQKQIIQLQRAY